MPEFVLNCGDDDAARIVASLDSFAYGYLEAMFFTSTGMGEDEGLEHATVADLAPETWDRIKADCTAFADQHAELLDAAYDQEAVAYDATQAGRDFWYTRCGHGVGFWDRGLPDDLGDRLTEAVNRFRSVDLYASDDGRLYLE